MQIDCGESAAQRLDLWIRPQLRPGWMFKHGPSPLRHLDLEQFTPPCDVASSLSLPLRCPYLSQWVLFRCIQPPSSVHGWHKIRRSGFSVVSSCSRRFLSARYRKSKTLGRSYDLARKPAASATGAKRGGENISITD